MEVSSVNLIKLQELLENIVTRIREDGHDPAEVEVAIQVSHDTDVKWAEDFEASWDAYTQTSGVVLHGEHEDTP